MEKVQEQYAEPVSKVLEGWRNYIQSLEASLNGVEKQIIEAGKTSSFCTEDWCTATEQLMEDLFHAVFTVHTPAFITAEDNNKLKNLKKRIQELYAQFKSVPGYAPSGI